jgi:hypothetical protein
VVLGNGQAAVEPGDDAWSAIVAEAVRFSKDGGACFGAVAPSPDRRAKVNSSGKLDATWLAPFSFDAAGESISAVRVGRGRRGEEADGDRPAHTHAGIGAGGEAPLRVGFDKRSARGLDHHDVGGSTDDRIPARPAVGILEEAATRVVLERMPCLLGPRTEEGAAGSATGLDSGRHPHATADSNTSGVHWETDATLGVLGFATEAFRKRARETRAPSTHDGPRDGYVGYRRPSPSAVSTDLLDALAIPSIGGLQRFVPAAAEALVNETLGGLAESCQFWQETAEVLLGGR